LYHYGYLDANLAMLANAIAALPGLYVVLSHIASSRSSIVGALQAACRNWPYGKWLVLVALAWMLSDGFLRWLLVGAKGQQALGAFAGAFLIVSLVNPVLLAMTSFSRSVASLRLATGSHLTLTSATITSVRRLAFFSTIAFLFLHFFGDPFLVMVLGESYSNPGLVSLLAVAVCIEVVVVPAEASIVALEYGRLLSLIASARLVVSVVAGSLLIPSFGDWGLAASMLCRSLVVLIVHGFVLWRLHRQFSMDAELSGRQPAAPFSGPATNPVEQTKKSEKAAAFL
jgi:O-antigen/teichoic acid export membrane protein